MKDIIIFDIDGTLVESGKEINYEHAAILNELKNKYEIAVCGGGTLEKSLLQMNNLIHFDHYFSECGCVYNINKSKNQLELEQIYIKNIRKHKLYPQINVLIKLFLKFISEVDYVLSGHFVDLRNGIIYLSCVGMQATEEEREIFKEIDKSKHIREDLLILLKKEARHMGILDLLSINFGGSVGIGIYPNEYDKVQILKILKEKKYPNMIYFGDKYDIDGNDYEIINHPSVKGYKINCVADTYKIILNELI